MEAAGTERPAGWPGAPLARTGLLLLSTWVLAGAEITWGTTGGPGRLVSQASRPPALPPLLPRAAMNRWPEELATARRATALRRRSRLELLPRASGGEIPAEAEGTSPEDVRWVPAIPAPSTAASSRRTRRSQPPSTLERGDAWATAPADGAKGSRPQTKGSREEVRATRTGGPAAEELRLPSTSFALTGDSAHNQAMVHWSGHNSSEKAVLLYCGALMLEEESLLQRRASSLSEEPAKIYHDLPFVPNQTLAVSAPFQKYFPGDSTVGQMVGTDLHAEKESKRQGHSDFL
ncbi:hypothetical protein NN561_007171 [Cricetulus griseus]